MTVGERIRQARKARMYTQRELAEKAGVAAVTIQQYERGIRQPRIEQLEAIAKALGVPIAYLLLGPAPLDDDGGAPQLPADVQRVAASMEKMNEEGREKVVDYAEDLEASGRYKKHGQANMGKEA